jgi:serine protease Do
LRPIGRELARQLDLLVDAAVEIVTVESNGAAARAGLRPGDLVVAINGRVVTGLDDMHRLLSRVAGPVTLSIIRGRRRFEIEVEPHVAA